MVPQLPCWLVVAHRVPHCPCWLGSQIGNLQGVPGGVEHSARLLALTSLPGRLLCSGGDDSKIIVWNVTVMPPVRLTQWTAHSGTVFALASMGSGTHRTPSPSCQCVVPLCYAASRVNSERTSALGAPALEAGMVTGTHTHTPYGSATRVCAPSCCCLQDGPGFSPVERTPPCGCGTWATRVSP